MATHERADEPVSEGYGQELARFAADLTTLRIEQGKPSLRDIARHAPAARPLSESGVSEALAGRRLPSIDFLMALVKTLLLLGDVQRRQPAEDDPRLDHWRQRWGQLQRLHADEHRTRLAAPTALTEAESADRSALQKGKPLRCFVAMPGESMGATSVWDDITAIRERLLEPVARSIEEQTNRQVAGPVATT
ncbi:hypothetical protein Ais01nite_58160 [Asanoa ishikariensis]|uniref:Helix-turn-helix domain-containing protein n=1 Tax=Asanoa ishikariensis TaxID=137265 RepID=A0A1H3V065_9ACTN|nr:hypothetical protein [Asanoa ishikariensis]GIF67781.1 hypothetical protein Ais01nite_58160 [Asanoa ishikariensis]SDZ67946.1 hypothetical protein SAMN05421684_0002 [Asanoa ishikariensis]